MLAQLSPGAASILPMCGRYASFLPAEAIARLFGTVNPLPNLAPSWNVAPTQDAAVVRRNRETGQRHLDLLKWGLLPYWTKDPTETKRPINARSETASKSRMFGECAGTTALPRAGGCILRVEGDRGRQAALRDRGPALPVRLQPRPAPLD